MIKERRSSRFKKGCFWNDFTVTGFENFVDKILVGVGNKMTISKVERNKSIFTGLDFEALEDSIKVSMQEYVNSLEDVEDIMKTDIQFDALSGIKLKPYQKMTGRIYWLAQNTCPHMC